MIEYGLTDCCAINGTTAWLCPDLPVSLAARQTGGTTLGSLLVVVDDDLPVVDAPLLHALRVTSGAANTVAELKRRAGTGEIRVNILIETGFGDEDKVFALERA